MANTKIIRGYTVYYDDNAAKGIEHLAYVLSIEESDSKFSNARATGKLKFEDRLGRNYTLIYNFNGTFKVEARSGWW